MHHMPYQRGESLGNQIQSIDINRNKTKIIIKIKKGRNKQRVKRQKNMPLQTKSQEASDDRKK